MLGHNLTDKRLDKDEVIKVAKLQFGSDNEYRVKKTEMGWTLYAHVLTPGSSSGVRGMIPGRFEGYYTIVTHTSLRDDDDIDISDIKN
tara:strand:+ start:482 stop:745 length:264 start_codon:yes stop_codon:yes gene_type:complete